MPNHQLCPPVRVVTHSLAGLKGGGPTDLGIGCWMTQRDPSCASHNPGEGRGAKALGRAPAGGESEKGRARLAERAADESSSHAAPCGPEAQER